MSMSENPHPGGCWIDARSDSVFRIEVGRVLAQSKAQRTECRQTALFRTPAREGCQMTSIERTAYPRFKSALKARELEALYCPTEEDRAFVAAQTADPAQQ